MENQSTVPATVAVSLFRRFPIALYLYVFGGTGMGFAVGIALEGPNMRSLIVMAVACVMTIGGYFSMRPYMRLAKQAIHAHAIAKSTFEAKSNDAAA